MIPVIIIDDEALIRSLIKKSVDWESLGFSIIAEAENSEQALELSEQHHPRIAIVDINIPYINGLELAEILRHRYPAMVIIILTGYEEFNYARKAIKIGVLNYLLKPIDPAEFRASLLTAREAIQEEERRRYRLNFTGSAEGSDGKLDFLRALTTRSVELSTEEIDEGLRLFQIGLRGKNISVLILNVQLPSGTSPETVIPLLTSLFTPHYTTIELFSDEQGRIVLLGNLYSDGEELLQICTRTRRLLAVEHSLPNSIGIAPAAPEVRGISEAYSRAETALDERFYRGIDTIYSYSYSCEEENIKESSGYRSLFDRSSLLVLLRSGSRVEVGGVIASLFNELYANRPRRQYCEMAVMDVVSVVTEFLEENSVPIGALFTDGSDTLSSVQGMATLREMKQWLEQFIDHAFDGISGNVTTRTRMIALKAKRYMENHHANPNLSLDQIAEHISVTPSYISGVFKKQIGVSIVGYLTDFRIRRAKLLMDQNPLIPVGDIAYKVGYSDAFYFSKVFRKQTGISPSAYIRRKGLSGS